MLHVRGVKDCDSEVVEWSNFVSEGEGVRRRLRSCLERTTKASLTAQLSLAEDIVSRWDKEEKLLLPVRREMSAGRTSFPSSQSERLQGRTGGIVRQRLSLLKR
jgi:hypothetical protein